MANLNAKIELLQIEVDNSKKGALKGRGTATTMTIKKVYLYSNIDCLFITVPYLYLINYYC
jgi:hypothetical protein